jgi:hypothetical protein
MDVQCGNALIWQKYVTLEIETDVIDFGGLTFLVLPNGNIPGDL